MLWNIVRGPDRFRYPFDHAHGRPARAQSLQLQAVPLQVQLLALKRAARAERSCGRRTCRSRRQRLGEKGVEQAAARVVAGGEARLQPVAQRHQFIDLGDDAVLRYHATNPNGTRNDNYSTRGNVNPWTGKAGTKPGD